MLIIGDKYLSQDLVNVMLRNITQLCQVRQRGVGEGGEPSRDRLLSHKHSPSYHEALTQCCFNVAQMLKKAGQH